MSDTAKVRVTLLADEDVEECLSQLTPHIETAAQTAGKHEDLMFHVTVLLTGEREIRELNRSFRNVDSVTDVLSFPACDFAGHIRTCAEAERDGDGVLELGDIAICVPRAAQQAEELAHSMEREVAFLTLHGVLHLMGYDHETPEDEEIMTALQRVVMGEMGAE